MKIHNIDATGSFTYNGVDLSNLTGSTTDSGSISTKIDNLNLSTSSLNSFTSSINTTIKNKLDSESVISGSVQVLITGTTGYSDFSSSISSSIGSLSGSVSTTTSNLSSSVGSLSSSIATTTSNLSSSVGNISSSIATTTSDFSSSIGSLSGSVATTTSGLASRIGSVESKTGSYATTGSNVFIGSQIITGSICSTGNIVTTGQIVAQTINVQQVTSSIVYSSGSNIFGNNSGNTHQFTGSLQVSGSSHNILGNVGMGTTSPVARLQIIRDGTGSSNTSLDGSQLILSRTTGNSENIAFRNTGASNGISGTSYAGQIISHGNNILEIYTNVSNPIIFGTDATERMRITPSGSIEIGTTGISSPSGADRFIGIYGAQDSSLILQDNVQTWELYVNDDFYINRGSTNVLTLNRTTGTSTFTSNSGIRVGSTDGGRVFIRQSAGGDAEIGANANGGLFLYANNVLGLSFTGAAATFASSVTANGDVYINNSSNAQIGFNTTGALNTVGAYQYFNRSSVNKWTAGMGPADGSDNYQIVTGGVKALQLTVTTGAATFASTVDTVGVSIGVAPTANILVVRGENATNDGTIKFGVRGHLQHRDAGNTITSLANDYNSDSAKMEFRMKGNTTSDAKITLLGSGNVGIGTDSPDTYSYGGARKFLTLRATATNEEPFLQLIANGVGNSIIDFGNATIRRASIIGLDGSSLTFFTNGTNSGTSVLERMRITSGGAMFNRASTAGHTAFIGAIGPGNVGNRYLHVRINTIQNMMVWIKIFGYAYTVGNIEGLSGGYVDGSTGAVAQSFQNGSIVAQYQSSSYLEIVVDTISTGTGNRWGSISFMGGTDNITTIQPLEIMAYSWTSTTTRVY
jgi:hypothetical protein